MVGAATASAAPVIINQPFSAYPGDVISLEGSGFGTAPKVYLRSSLQTIVLPTKSADDGAVVVEVPKTVPFDLYAVWVANSGVNSPSVLLNAPNPMHFDNAEIASGAHFRIFGRNLYVNNAPPSVVLVDVQTKAQVKTTITLSTSSAYCLDVLPSAGIIAGHSYQAYVSNGYKSAWSPSILGHAAGIDYFGIGQPWAYDFVYQDGPGYKPGVAGSNKADHHVFNVQTDPSLSLHAAGDGMTDDSRAIQAAVDAAALNGGLVYLPPGTYSIPTRIIQLRSNVVVQGAGAGATKIVYGQGAIGGLLFTAGTQMAGLADLTIQNIDLTSKVIANLYLQGNAGGKLFLQRINWDLGSGRAISIAANRVAILNSTFTQAINYQNGDASKMTGGLGPIYLGGSTNLQFKNNIIKWKTDQNSMNDIVNAVIENNHFTRSASDTIAVGPADPSWGGYLIPMAPGAKLMRAQGRQLTINFGKNVVIQNNIFDTSDGDLNYNWNDGETILNEAGAVNHRADFGTVTDAASTSVTDNSKCTGICPWRVYPNSMLTIVSGAGAGQWRHIIQQTGNTFTLDAPFDVVPSAGDHFAIQVPAYENAIIRNNTMTGNPVGIGMYRGAFLNVSITGNQLTNNGGTYLFPGQNNLTAAQSFDVSRNIEINGNTLTNTNGLFPSYITIQLKIQSYDRVWGKSAFASEIRSNNITAKPGTRFYFSDEGYKNFATFQSPTGPFVEEGKGELIGTVFQGDSCTNCPVNYLVSVTAMDTTIWNAVTANAPGIASTFLSDVPMRGGKEVSIRTIVGHD